jgi:hypothetical protein
MDIKTIGVDIGKNKFHLHRVNQKEKQEKIRTQDLYVFIMFQRVTYAEFSDHRALISLQNSYCFLSHMYYNKF